MMPNDRVTATTSNCFCSAEIVGGTDQIIIGLLMPYYSDGDGDEGVWVPDLQCDTSQLLFKYTSTSSLLSILKHKSWKFNNLAYVNDPLEALPAQGGNGYSVHRGYIHMREWFLNSVGFTSFSAVWPNSSEAMLLWSHYADKHRGVAIGIDRAEFSRVIFKDYAAVRKLRYRAMIPGCFYPVRYCKRRMLFHESHFGLSTSKTTRRMRLKLLCRKGEAWKYEKEYRLFTTTKDSGFYKADQQLYKSFGRKYVCAPDYREQGAQHVFVPFPIKSIKCIYFGCELQQDPIWNTVKFDSVTKKIKKILKCPIYFLNIDKEDYRISLRGNRWFGREGI